MLAWARRRPDRYEDWYWGASPEDRREYDAFGPWVDLVRNEEEMPARFRSAYDEHREARFLLKVPINADRRDVRPGMALYRQVVAVHDDHLSVLSVIEGKLTTRTITWGEVVAIRSMTNLLSANWSLLLAGGETLTIEYNSVSSRRLDAVTSFVRDRVTPGVVRSGGALPAGANVAIADLFFQNMLLSARAVTAKPAAPVHFEPRDRPCRTSENRRRLTTGLLVLDTPGELMIIDRGEPARRFFHPTYAARTTFIPYKRLSAFAVVPPPPGKAGFHALRLFMDRQVIDQPCLGEPFDVIAVLAEHGMAQKEA